MALNVPQPYYAWLRFFVHDVDFILDANRPQRLLSFRHELSISSLGSFELEVFDPTFHGIEAVLWASYQQEQANLAVKFQYGYTSPTGVTAASPQFYGFISKYTPQWSYNGVTLTISGTMLPAKNQRSKDDSFREMLIHEIVREIAKREGWRIGKLEETAPIYLPEDTEGSTPVLKTFQQCRMDSFRFIVQELCPWARTRDGRYGFVARLDDRTKPPTLHFFVPEPNKEKGSFPIRRTFTIRRDRMEEWLDFNYTIEVSLGEVKGTFEWKYADFDPVTGDLVVDTKNVDNASQDIVFHGDAPIKSDGTADQPNVAQRRDVHAVRHAQERRHYLMSKLVSIYRGVFSATLTIVGDPEVKVKPGEFIKILNYLPDGGLHYSSGIYMVNKVVNEIRGGEFTTTYELNRNAALMQATPKQKPKETG